MLILGLYLVAVLSTKFEVPEVLKNSGTRVP